MKTSTTKPGTLRTNLKDFCEQLDRLYPETSKSMVQIYHDVRLVFANRCSTPGKELGAQAQAWGHFQSELNDWVSRLPPKLRKLDQDLIRRFFYNMAMELRFRDVEEIKKQATGEGEANGKD